MKHHRLDAVPSIAFAIMVSCGPLASVARAEDGPPPPVAGEELTVRVLTIRSGNHPLLTLGESAIWIQDEHAGRGVVYQLGALEPDSLASAFTWLTGRLKNQATRVPIDEALQSWRSRDRTVDTQELTLTPAARLALRADLDAAVALAANRGYDYDPFVVSGATRVRDLVDKASGGRLRAATQRGRADETLRQATLASARNLFPAYLILAVGQGAAADRSLGPWDRLFIPGEIQKTLRRIGRVGSWNDPPLMASEGTIVAPRGEPAAEADDRRDPGGGRLIVVGLVLGTLLAGCGRAARRRPPYRVVLGAATGTIGLALGLLGTALLVGWLFGNPLIARRNENILQLAPWTLALPVLAIGVAMGRRAATRAAFWIAVAAAALSAAGLVLKATPWFRQENLVLIGLFLPIWTGLAAGLWALALDEP
jgi:hypothetical protein